jgi:hypothetical protein
MLQQAGMMGRTGGKFGSGNKVKPRKRPDMDLDGFSFDADAGENNGNGGSTGSDPEEEFASSKYAFGLV